MVEREREGCGETGGGKKENALRKQSKLVKSSREMEQGQAPRSLTAELFTGE